MSKSLKGREGLHRSLFIDIKRGPPGVTLGPTEGPKAQKTFSISNNPAVCNISGAIRPASLSQVRTSRKSGNRIVFQSTGGAVQLSAFSVRSLQPIEAGSMFGDKMSNSFSIFIFRLSENCNFIFYFHVNTNENERDCSAFASKHSRRRSR